jgi:cardiolipin synthase A/B
MERVAEGRWKRCLRAVENAARQIFCSDSFTLALCSVLSACGLILAGCENLPDKDRQLEIPNEQIVEFEGARGPVSARQGDAILDALKSKSGDIDVLKKHLALEQTINADEPLVLDNKLVLLQDGPITYKAMFKAMRAAKDHINLETYIIEDDEVGRQFADLLLERQAAGIQVNLVYDSVGGLSTPREFFRRLSDGGIHVLEFNPVNPLAGNKKEWLLNNRDHRKLLIVDGRVAFLGGINISASYSSSPFSRSGRKNGKSVAGWRDTHLQIEGPAVAKLQTLFIDTWKKQRGEPLAQKNYFPKLDRQGAEIVRIIGSSFDDPYSLIYLTLLSAISNAEQRAYLTIAYFVPDPKLLEALTDTAGRNVDVRLILPGQTDSWAVFHAGRSHYTDLLRAGVKIYERQGTVMHAKTAVIDGVWSTIGSTNLDWRSFLHNDELNAVIIGPDFGRQMEVMFAQDLTESREIQLTTWKHRPFRFRVEECLGRLVEYWL